jgi:hypothetical protein
MTSRLLLTAILLDVAARRKRNSDGALFAVMKVRDTDKNESRVWTVFINDLETIERAEDLRKGEPIAITGPFSVAIAGPPGEPTLEHRITAESFVDTRRRRKSKTQKRIEERIASDDEGPQDGVGSALDDALPF